MANIEVDIAHFYEGGRRLLACPVQESRTSRDCNAMRRACMLKPVLVARGVSVARESARVWSFFWRGRLHELSVLPCSDSRGFLMWGNGFWCYDAF